MNSVNFKIAARYTKFIALFLFTSHLASAWEVDLSRRQVDFQRVQNQSRLPASMNTSESISLLGSALVVTEPVQEVVIMNTEKGFVPQTLKLKKDGNYKIHVVNINQKEKNVSFILDAFSEHHNTLFGESRTFELRPKVDGIFSFLSPETGLQGKIIIYSQDENRLPASQ